MRLTHAVSTWLLAVVLLMLIAACVLVGWVAWSVGGMW